MLRSDVNANPPERRAMTPGPEWGRYDSDDEETDKKKPGEHKHFRQSSYLTAMEELSNGMAAMNSQPQQQFDANIGSYNVNKAAYTSAVQNNHAYDSVDSGQRYPQSSGYNTNSSNPAYKSQGYNGYYNQQNSVPQEGYNQSGYSQSGYNGYQNAYPQQQMYPQQGQCQSQGYPQQGPSQNAGYSQHGHTNQQGYKQSSVMTCLQQQQQYPAQQRSDPRSQAAYPSHAQVYGDMSRNQSSQNAPASMASTNSRNTAQHRPQSAHTQSNHTQGHYDSRPASAHSHGYNSQGHFDPRQTHPAANRNQSPVKRDRRNSQDQWNDLNEDDSYGTYINTKAVEKVLGIQGKNSRNRTTSANYAHVEISTARPSPEVDAYSLNSTKTGLVKEQLSVDTGDSDSHKDSGYRSGGSSGDRNSSSSNSVSIDSPIDANKQYGYNHLKYPQPANQQFQGSQHSYPPSQHSQHPKHSYQATTHHVQQPKQLSQPPMHSNQPQPTRHQQYMPMNSIANHVPTKVPIGFDGKSYPSTESLSSGSASAGSVGTVKTLTTRPTSSERVNMATSRVISKSEESLAIIEDNTKPVKDLVKQLDTKVRGGQIQVQQSAPKTSQKPKPPTPQRTTSTLSSSSTKTAPSSQNTAHSNIPNGPSNQSPGKSNGPTDALYMQADGLMEVSQQKEMQGDLHAALVHINQAIGCLQQLLNQASTSPETLVHVRVKHNSAVLKSRALLHKIQNAPSRQYSNSTVSSDDLSSVSSMSTDTSDGRGSHCNKEPVIQSHKHQHTHKQPHITHNHSLHPKQIPTQPKSISSEAQQRHQHSHIQNTSQSGNNDRHNAKTMEFPKPVGASIVTTRDDFPRMSQRRKFMSDYVSREDYFSHHPPPPNYNGVAQKASSKPVNEAVAPQIPQDFQIPVPKPSLPPKPAVQPKPKLKHSMSTEKQKTYPEVDETGGINIYATLPRRPKNRERSSTLGSNQQAEVYQAYLNNQKQKEVMNHTNSSYGQENRAGYPQERRAGSEQLPSNLTGATNHMNSAVNLNKGEVNHVRRGSRDDMVNSDYKSRVADETDEHNLSIESMVTQQINQLTLTKSHSGPNATHPFSSQNQGHSRSQDQRQGPVIQRVMPQQTVHPSSQLPVYPHPPMYQGRQSSVESHSSNESSGSQLSKLEAHQMAVMHQRDGPGSLQAKYPQKHELRKSSSNSHLVHNSSTNTHVGSNVKLVQSPKKSKHMGGQRSANEQQLASNSSKDNETSEPLQLDLRVTNEEPKNSSKSKHSKHKHSTQRLHRSGSNNQLDSTDFSDFSHISSVPLSQGRHCDSLDTLVNEESCFTSCVVVDGCEYVVEKSKAELSHPNSHVTIADLVEKESNDTDLQDFCIIEQVGSTKLKEPSDCSSSSGIERTDTQSDTSSYTSRTKETKSVLVKKKKQKGFKPRKNVTFSDKVALVSTAPEEVEPQQPTDYIAYVQALLKRSPGKRSSETDSEDPSITPSTPLPPRSSTPIVDAAGKSGYDSDFDEETDDSCASDEMASTDKVQCNLCRKKLIDATQMFCQDCSYYMSQFTPTAS